MVRIISVMEEACPYYLGELRTRHSSEAPDMPFPEWLSDHLTEIREDMTRGKLAITGGS